MIEGKSENATQKNQKMLDGKSKKCFNEKS